MHILLMLSALFFAFAALGFALCNTPLLLIALAIFVAKVPLMIAEIRRDFGEMQAAVAAPTVPAAVTAGEALPMLADARVAPIVLKRIR